MLRRLGEKGFVKPSADTLQVVLGPQADQVAGEIRASLAKGPAAAGPQAEAIRRALPAGAGELELRDSRVLVRVPDGAQVDEAALAAAGVRGVFRKAGRLHLVIGPHAEEVFQALRPPATT